MNRSRWLRIAALAALCLVPVTACQPRAGAAAFVGNTRIGDNRVQDLTAEGLRDPAVSKGVQDVSAYRGIVLSRLIKHELIRRAAARLEVKVSDGELTQLLKSQRERAGGAKQLAEAVAAAPLSLPKNQLMPFFRDLILLDRIGTELAKDRAFTEAQLRAFYDANDGASVAPFDQLKPQVLAALRGQAAATEREKFIKDFLGKVRVRVNPRYGSFDATKFLDPGQGPVLKPAPDDFFRGPAHATQPTGSPAK